MVRTKLGRYAAGFMALAVTLAFAATAAAQVGTVKGKVMDAQGNPVEGATVSIVQKGSKSGRTLKTNKKGEFVQVGIFPGQLRDHRRKRQREGQRRDDGEHRREPRCEPEALAIRVPRPKPRPSRTCCRRRSTKASPPARPATTTRRSRSSPRRPAWRRTAPTATTTSAYAQRRRSRICRGPRRPTRRPSSSSPITRRAGTDLANVYNAEKKLDLALETTARPDRRRRRAPGLPGAGRQRDVALQRGRHPLEPGQVPGGKSEVRGGGEDGSEQRRTLVPARHGQYEHRRHGRRDVRRSRRT